MSRETFKTLWGYCTSNNRLCPNPQQWNNLSGGKNYDGKKRIFLAIKIKDGCDKNDEKNKLYNSIKNDLNIKKTLKGFHAVFNIDIGQGDINSGCSDVRMA